MDKVEIRDDQVVSMDAIAPGLHGLRMTFVNVFGVEHPQGGWTLIDAGIPYSAGIIKRWAEKTFGRPPRAIVLTHGHFDHVSAATELCNDWHLPVYAHQLEFPYLTGEKEFPKPNAGAGGGMMSLLSPLYPRGPVDLRPRLQEFGPEGDHVPMMPEWRLVERRDIRRGMCRSGGSRTGY